MIKLSLDNLESASMGVLVCHGGWVVGFSGFLSVITNMHIELVTICEGLKIIDDLGEVNVEIDI